AEDTADAVKIEYEPLQPVPDARAAIATGAALLHEGLGDNIAADFTVRVGDADAAFRKADVVTRETYYVHRYTGMPLETRGVAACSAHRSLRPACPGPIESGTTRAASARRSRARRRRRPIAAPASPRRSSPSSARWITWRSSSRSIPPSFAGGTSFVATSSRGTSGPRRLRFP